MQAHLNISQTASVVDQARLMADVVALSYPRHTESDRQAARDYISQSLTQSGWAVAAQEFGEDGVNLVAQLPVLDEPEENSGDRTLVLGTHYDTVTASPGADDNASGVAVLLEVARLMAALPEGRSLQLVFFDQEEVGLLGSRAFVDEAAQQDNVMAAIVLDMVGYACRTPGCQTYPALPLVDPPDQGTFLAVVGDVGHPDLVAAFKASEDGTLPPILGLTVPTVGASAPDLLRSDHAPFWEQGIGAALVTDTANFRNPHYHQPSDRPETLDPVFFAGSAQHVFNAVRSLLSSTMSAAS